MVFLDYGMPIFGVWLLSDYPRVLFYLAIVNANLLDRRLRVVEAKTR
jgi:hypothetical protein